jgi:hypothetical protein
MDVETHSDVEIRSEDRIESAVRTLPGWEGRQFVIEPALPVLASPSWRGVDGAPWRARDQDTGESLFIKAMHPEAGLYIDVACAMEAVVRAGKLGIGPKVFIADLETGLVIMEDLTDGWRVAGLECFRTPSLVDKILEARRRFQDSTLLPRTVSVFDEIERFYGDVKNAGATLPVDADWLYDHLSLVAAAVRPGAGAPVAIHGDGNVSNVMISQDGDVRLLDWDRATNAEALQDFGSVLVEGFPFDPEAREVFTRHWGRFDQRAFDRARLYGVADDFRWGLIGSLLAALSPRKFHEFFKFASWRFLRCRLAVREPRFAERLRSV